MMATISGSPSSPARTNDCGVPPTPSQIGSGFCIGRRIDALPGQRGTVLSGPMHLLVCTNVEQEVELLGKECIVVLQPEAEERKRFDGGAAADDHFRAAP